jgi:hypothetical protein
VRGDLAGCAGGRNHISEVFFRNRIFTIIIDKTEALNFVLSGTRAASSLVDQIERGGYVWALEVWGAVVWRRDVDRYGTGSGGHD